MKTFNKQKFNRLIIVAYRLPFKLVRKKGEYHAVQNSGGLVSAILSLAENMTENPGSVSQKILWVGSGEEQLGEKNIHPKFDLFPVEIPRVINDKYYGGFCNDTIWPLFHYFPTRTVFDTGYYDAYVKANRLFCQRLQSLLQPGDFVWIHDYQLFLLPGMVRERFPDANIGFFLHIPFPSYEIFRLLPGKWREDILKGIVNSDIVGFHTNDYCQHFIKSVKRILGSKVERNIITLGEHLCKADAFPIGIDYRKFRDAISEKKTVSCNKRIRSHISDRRFIFSIDRLDYSKGFLHRLTAFERFLEKYPEWHHKVVFNMIVIPSRDNIEGYRRIKKEIESTVGRINGRYSTLNWWPVIYQYKSVPFNELVAMYNISDVGLITPLRDGMNLVAKEFIASQKMHYGMLVLSEMAGAACELTEAIIINPTDSEGLSDAINEALLMPEEEKEKRVHKMQLRMKRYDVYTWARDFLNQVYEIKKRQGKMKVTFMDSMTINSLLFAYKNSHNRLFLIDYDGTLTPIVTNPELAEIDGTAEKILRKITSDKRNNVVIISGRDRNFMEKQFHNLNVIMVAEHGLFIKYPEAEWENTTYADHSWKEKTLPLLNDFVDKLSGSVVEEKSGSLAWHYRNTDDSIAHQRLNELKDRLADALSKEDKLQIVDGDKVLEIKSILYDKGTVADNIIKKGEYDFIFAMGDDRTDEDLFKIVPDFGFTVKVGNNLTDAQFNVKTQLQAIELLSHFSK